MSTTDRKNKGVTLGFLKEESTFFAVPRQDNNLSKECEAAEGTTIYSCYNISEIRKYCLFVQAIPQH